MCAIIAPREPIVQAFATSRSLGCVIHHQQVQRILLFRCGNISKFDWLSFNISTQSFTSTSLFSHRSGKSQTLMIQLSYVGCFYRVGQSDIIIVISGRYCSDMNRSFVAESDCETVLIDNFRHERTTLVTYLDRWCVTVSMLRCFGQRFMYLRILALWIGCYHTTSSELKMAQAHFRQKIVYAWTSLFKIPGHVIVYCCWPPIVAYTLVHLIDIAAIHMRAESFGTVNGEYSFSLVANLAAATVQMRNIWWIAIAVKLLTWIQTRVFPSKCHRKYGFLCVRGTWIGCISAITIFAPLETIQHRDSRIVKVQKLSNAGFAHAHLQHRSEYRADVGIALDAKTITEASFLVFVVISFTKLWFWLVLRHCRDRSAPSFEASMVICRPHYLPYSPYEFVLKSSVQTIRRAKRLGQACSWTISEGHGVQNGVSSFIGHKILNVVP